MTCDDTPAAVFDTEARRLLRIRNERPSVRAIAKILGESKSFYHRAVRAPSVTTATLQRWINAWAAAGYPEIEIRLRRGSVVARLASNAY